jgi:hypothetical protein
MYATQVPRHEACEEYCALPAVQFAITAVQ